MKEVPRCRACGDELTNANWYPSHRQEHQYRCKRCDREYKKKWDKTDHAKAYHHKYTITHREQRTKTMRKWRRNNPAKERAAQIRSSRKRGAKPMDKNTACSAYLGVHVAEQVLSKVFKSVERMPHNNTGFDFICNHGKKIDVKSSCQTKRDTWTFNIGRNIIADFFLCLAFDNRDDLNPLNIWLIPGSEVSHKYSISFKDIGKNKWTKYQLDINKVVTCCDVMRS